MVVYEGEVEMKRDLCEFAFVLYVEIRKMKKMVGENKDTHLE